MRITNGNVRIDEFSTVDGECIEINEGSQIVNVRLLNNDNGQLVDHFFTPVSFREMLSAMNTADQELIKIEQRP